MGRDSAATRRRILDAAAAEFSQRGFAGARVDRIAAASRSNKSSIYAYFISKDGLFEAVFDAMVVQTVSDVPIDIEDLPEWAARLYDQHLAHPEPLRIQRWDALERGGVGMLADTVRSATNDKIEAIAGGQRRQVLSDRLPPDQLMTLIIAISQIGVTEGLHDRHKAAARRETIKTAVAALIV